jgi:hypothetical protein
MDREIRRLRAQVQRLAQGKPRSQVRYPEPFRRAVVKLARQRRGQGPSVTDLAQALGVSEPTLAKWLRPTTPPRLRPVALVSAPAPVLAAAAHPVLITPSGVRVEHLDRETLVAVLQALR